jgi:hypothetical protein
MRREASALVKFSSKSSLAFSRRVVKQDRCAPVIGSSPVVQFCGALIVFAFVGNRLFFLSVMKTSMYDFVLVIKH